MRSVRICVDLNVWCSDVLSRAMGRTGTAAQVIVDAARAGSCAQGEVQLIVSWGMLNRLEEVLHRLKLKPADASAIIEAIAGYAVEGPAITLGGVGVLAMDDEEDRHVLETAWAGDADMLVTANFKDFPLEDAEVLAPGELALLRRGDKRLYLIGLGSLARWLQGKRVKGLKL